MFITDGGCSEETGIKNEKSIKVQLLYSFLALISVLFTAVIIILNNSEENKETDIISEKTRLSRLKEKKFSLLNKDEKRDFCIYSRKIEKVIYPECFCKCDDEFIEGSINWFSPPEPDKLGSEWIELAKHPSDPSNSRYFQNKMNFNIIRYDESHPGKKTGNHYHRYNKNIKNFKDLRKYKKGNEYLDICGKELESNIDEKNHLPINNENVMECIN